MSDEIILALRATKEKLAEQAEFDIERLVQAIRQEENLSAMQGRVVLQPQPDRAPQLGFQKIRFASH